MTRAMLQNKILDSRKPDKLTSKQPIEIELDDLMQLIDQYCSDIEKQTAAKIFSLAHQYAQDDKTMVGAEELRAYHYLNAIHTIGKFDGR